MAAKEAKPAGAKDAKDAKPAAEAAAPAAAPAKGGKNKLVIAALAGVLVLGGGGAGAWFAFGKSDDKAAGGAKEAARKVPVFVDLETFTVNLRDAEAERFLQVKLVAEVKDTASGEMVKTMMPAVRNEILLLLGSKQAGEVATREGKEKLAKEIVLAANKPLEGTPGAKAIEGVNFTHLIVQ